MGASGGRDMDEEVGVESYADVGGFVRRSAALVSAAREEEVDGMKAHSECWESAGSCRPERNQSSGRI
jgi:hypothetical protein